MKIAHYKCIVCSSQNFNWLGINNYFYVSIWECIGCGFRQTEWVSPEAVRYYYEKWYRHKMTFEQINICQQEYMKTADYQFSIIQKHISGAINSLDYGGATGELADKLRLISEKVHVSEYDPNYLPVLVGKGYQILSDSDLLSSKTSYDLVTCSHVIEHFQNPYELLRTFRDITHQGSIVYIEVPNDYLLVESSAYGKGHLSFFDTDSLHTFLKKQNNFDLIGMYTHNENSSVNYLPVGCIGVVLKRNNSDQAIEVVQQDLEKIIALYSAKLVFSAGSLIAHQKVMVANNINTLGVDIPTPIG